MKKIIKKTALISSLLIVFYLIIHLADLTRLPVFADEAIYIRWAQLIIDDWQQYLFFPLNDGKTPFFIWLMLPFQFLFENQLFAGRIVSVLIGLLQVFTIKWAAAALGGSKLSQWLGAVLAAVLPFWYFHHHLALMDGLLTLMLSLVLLFIIKNNNHLKRTERNSSKSIFWSGLFFGLAIWTKLPALLFIPSLVLFSMFYKKLRFNKRTLALTGVTLSILIGLLIFVTLKIHPAFSQLFTRGGDFLFPWEEIVFEQKWRQTLPSWLNYLNYFGTYLTWPVILLSVLGLLTAKKRTVLTMHLGWIAFAAPIFILGKVVYPRYLMPVSLFFTLAAVISFGELIKKNLVIKIASAVLILASLFCSGRFIWAILNNPAQAEFVEADKVQYLKEWSAGYGIKETVEIIQEIAKKHEVLVLAEGYFGTMPDGLLMYLHRRDVRGLFVTGIGQPIGSIPNEALKDLEKYDRVLLTANSHRLKLDLSQADLIYENCRPFNSPCHQVWDVTEMLLE